MKVIHVVLEKWLSLGIIINVHIYFNLILSNSEAEYSIFQKVRLEPFTSV